MDERIKLRCLSNYANTGHKLGYAAGQEFETTPVLARFLMADSPGSFEMVKDEPEVKAVEAPATNKMMTAPGKKK